MYVRNVTDHIKRISKWLVGTKKKKSRYRYGRGCVHKHFTLGQETKKLSKKKKNVCSI